MMPGQMPQPGMPPAPGGAPGAMPGADPQATGPLGSPGMHPQEASGEHAQGMAMAQSAIEMLSMSLPLIGAMSDEGEAIMTALKSLTKKIGLKAQQHGELVPAQIEMLKNSAAGGPDVSTMLAMRGGGQGGMQSQPGM